MQSNKTVKLKQRIMQLTNQKKYEDAKKSALKLTKICPKDIEAWYALAQLQEQLGELENSVKSLCKACQAPSPIYAATIKKIVLLCYKHNFYHLGTSPAQALVKLNPEEAGSHFYLGCFWFHLHYYRRAEPSLLKAVELQPDEICFLNYCGHLYSILSYPEKSLSYYGQSQKIDSDDCMAFHGRLLAYNYINDVNENVVFEAHKAYGSKIEYERLTCDELSRFTNERPEKLRVGFVSKDFRLHSVAYFFQALIEGYSPDKFKIYCYSDVDHPDNVTERIKCLSDVWCDSLSLSDLELSQKIMKDEIDILVDLVGYTRGSRMSVFAARVAPIQVSYLGYPNTTGLSRMDFRITDALSDPVGLTEKWYTESLKRLPSGFLCYSPSENAPVISLLPAKARQDKSICFGSFNSFQKISFTQIESWAAILKRVPQSRFFFKSGPLVDESVCEDIWQVFEKHDVSKARVELSGWTHDTASHLELYAKIDIHLDSFPYNGTTTTCEALWQGVPTVTLAGEVHRSRVGLSINKRVGLDDFIAETEQEYIDIAVQKASDLDALEVVRLGMRERMSNSLLMDKTEFIQDIESCFEEMWRDYSAKL